MKTRILLSIIAIGLFLSSFGQNTIELTFTGQDETTSNHVTLDSIFIRNMDKGIDTMLTGNDTTLLLNLITGINESSEVIKPFELQQNYPNPFRDRTTFAISVFQKEDLDISLFDIYGQKLTGISGAYETGTHLFTLTGSQSKFYILRVTGQSHSASIKLINSHPTGGTQHNITYAGNQPIGAYYKVVMSKDGFPYTFGDELLMVGYADGYEFSVLNESPEVSTDYTFPFDFVDTFVCGDIFVDERDGKEYQTIKIDRQCWMTQNMNLGEMIPGTEEQQDNENFEKYCYDDNEDNCNDFGGLYQWDEMMQYDTSSTNQGICPKGWHLPTIKEWNSLIDYYGGPTVAGDSLKLGGNSGFDALMAGYRNTNDNFLMLNDEAYFWTSIYQGNSLAYYNSLTQSGSGVSLGGNEKQYGYSVRCLKGLPLELDTNVVTIDTTVYTLISDSLELAQGIYKYEYNGKRKSEDIVIGDAIIGVTGEGYLRKVNTIEDDPPILTLETTQATMEDVFVDGDFSTPFNLDSLQNAKMFFNKGEIVYLRDGVSLDVKDGGFDYSFDDVELFDNGNISLYITDGYVLFDPEFEFDFKFRNGTVRRLALYADESLLEESINVQFIAQYSGSIEDELTLAQYQHIMGFLIGVVPVWVTINLDLTAESNFNIDAQLELNAGYTNSNLISLGMVYENGEWDKIWELQQTNNFHPLAYDGSINLSQRLTLVPTVSIKLYSVAGPYFNAELWEQFIFNYVIPSLNTDASFDIGLDANVGAEVTIFGYTLAQYNKHIPGFEINIWNMPDEIQMISGNNQTAEVNQQLPEPVKVKVIDNFGNTFSNIPVHFEITEGGGSLSDEDVMVDVNGFAETCWTMGSTPDENKLTASVLKTDGIHIDGSPMEFTATATDDGTLATVTTANISNITETTAQGGGNVMDDGGSTVAARGICWNTSPSPTISNSHTTDGTGTGNFISDLTGLTPNTEYYVRAYATNDEGTAYGNQLTFTTDAFQTPTVTTAVATGITATYAQTGGNVTDEGSGSVTAKGVCWDTSPNPNLNDNYTTDGSGSGSFISILNGLTPNTTYYIKAYAANTYGTSYGNQISFTTAEATLPGADFTADILIGDAPLSISFTDLSTYSPYQWFWEFGDGFTSFTQHPTHTYNVAGVYTVSLTVDNVYGSDMETKTNYITVNATGGVPCPDIPTVNYGGQVYNTVLIGSQCWLKESLNIGTKIDGSQNMQDNSLIEKYCFDDDEDNCDVYGGMYQWNEMMQYTTIPGYQGICPNGWHIPTDEEWKQLEGEVDSQYDYPDPEWDQFNEWRGFDAGKNLKSTSGWYNNGNGSDLYGFSALPGGERRENGVFQGLTFFNQFWTSDLNEVPGYSYAYWRDVSYDSDGIQRYSYSKNKGLYVRCLKNEEPIIQHCPGIPTIEYGGQVYNTVQIGDQCWLKENLNIGVMIPGGQNMENNEAIEKYCFGNDESSCDIYGGLYQWNEIMQYTTQEETQGICPDGWHIPTDEEWKQLEGEVDSQFDYPDPEWDNYDERGSDVGYHLKSISGWWVESGSNQSGFTALPGGIYEGGFNSELYSAYYWSSTEMYEIPSWVRALDNDSPKSSRIGKDKLNGIAVRCLKD